MSDYKYLLMDFDDTLLDFELTEEYAFRNTMQRHGIEYTQEQYNRYREINSGLWHQLNEGKIKKEVLLVQRWETFFEELGIQIDPVEFDQAYLNALGEPVYYIDGVTKVLRELSKRCEIYVITNGVTHVQNSRLERADFKECIKGCFISEDVGFEKPQVEYFDYVFERIPGFEREKALIIGDSLGSDIRGGVNTGIKTCWYNIRQIENTTTIKPDYTIDSLEELLKIV